MGIKKLKVKKLQNTPYVICPQQVIGKGSFSTILRAYNTQNPSQQLVSKIISLSDCQTSQTIKTQLSVLKKLPHHANLVNCMKCQISSQNNFYLIMEYCNQGNLDKYMVRKKWKLQDQRIWFFLKQFTDGYKVLYENGVVHRDIKPENILIHNGDFKIADFGLAKNVDDLEIVGNMSAKGTPLYMAPQIHKEKEGSSKVDVFSLGVVLYRLAFGGQYPFFDQGRKYRSISEYFKQLMIRKLIIPNSNRSKVLVQLIQKMLIKDKQTRIGWQQIFQIQQIKNAIRYQRKKQLIPMQQLQRSFTIVNKSQTILTLIQPSGQQKFQQQSQAHICLEQTFNKKNKSLFEKVLFKTKLIYTLIEYTNRKILTFIRKLTIQGEKLRTELLPNPKYQKAFNYVFKKLHKVVQAGMIYALYLIARLQHVSGDWNQLKSAEIMNFQDIFENDKGIFLQQYKQILKNKSNNHQTTEIEQKKQNKQIQQNKQNKQIKQIQPVYIQGSYQDNLYGLLSEYFEYPPNVRAEFRPIYALLVDIYDLAIKSEAQQADQNDKNTIQKVQQQTSIEFYQYLLNVETVDEQSLRETMDKKGLIFS